MASRSSRQVLGGKVTSLGHYYLHGTSDDVRLTIPMNAAPEFPRELRERVEIKKITPDDGDAYLEVHPVGSLEE